MTVPDRNVQIAALRAARPRSWFLRGSMALTLVLIGAGWWTLEYGFADMLGASGGAYVEQLVTVEMRPKPLRDKPWDWAVFGDWLGAEMDARGWRAVGQTLAISVLAIVLAWLASLLLCLPAARNLATPRPFLGGGAPTTGARRILWNALYGTTRGMLILMRALPEYVLAFLLVSLLGRSAWPAVLALAIHNLGILGRLNAEVVENLPPRRLAALRGLGATRAQIAITGVAPTALPRWLLYFFYRWETCVREATVLGMLGLAGLGYWLNEADAHDREDLLILYALLGSVLVLIGDLVSAYARRMIRRA